MNQFLKDEGALVVLQSGNIGDAGTVFGQAGGSRDPKDPVPPPMVVVTPEHYNRVVRLLDHNIPVKLEFDIQAQFIDSPTDSFNVVGEIEGGRKKDEIVMLGAHLDSWHGGTGATDNATGSAVAIEAVRILKTLNLENGPHRAHRAVGWRRGRLARLQSLRHAAFRRPRDHAAQARIFQALRVLQRRHRHRPFPRHRRARQR